MVSYAISPACMPSHFTCAEFTCTATVSACCRLQMVLSQSCTCVDLLSPIYPWLNAATSGQGVLLQQYRLLVALSSYLMSSSLTFSYLTSSCLMSSYLMKPVKTLNI